MTTSVATKQETLRNHERGSGRRSGFGFGSKHKRYPRASWVKTIQAFECSSLLPSVFCAKHDLSLPSFYKWRQVLKAEKQQVSKLSSRFIPIGVVSSDGMPGPQSCDHHMDQHVWSDPTVEALQTQNDFLLQSVPVIVTPTKPPFVPSECSPASGLSLQLNESLKISIDKNFHGPTLQRLVVLFSLETRPTC